MAGKTAVPIAGSIPRVNLMPRVELERRQQAALIRRWGWGVVIALAVVVVVVVGAFGMKWMADQSLVAEQQRSAALQSQLTSLSKVSQALATDEQLGAFSTEARAADIDWTTTLSSIAAVMPAGVQLTGFDLTTGALPVKGASAASAPGLTGQLTMSSATPLDITPVIRSLRDVHGVISADGQGLTSTTAGSTPGGSPSYTYQLTVEFDQSLYTAAKGAR